MLSFPSFLKEDSTLETLTQLDGKTFAIIPGGDSETAGRLSHLLSKPQYPTLLLHGIRTQYQKDGPKREFDDINLVVIKPEGDKDEQFSQVVVGIARSMGIPAILVKMGRSDRIVRVGVTETPGAVRTFGEYSIGKFVKIVSEFFGQGYEFIGVSEI